MCEELLEVDGKEAKPRSDATKCGDAQAANGCYPRAGALDLSIF